MRNLITTLALLFAVSTVSAEEIGSVSTVFKLLGPNDKIVIEAFDDPKVEGVTCHLSRAKKGGVSGAVGLATDTSDAAIACRQVGPITIKEELEDGEPVFNKRRFSSRPCRSSVFWTKKKSPRLLVYSDKLIDGSPKNSISTVPILKNWGK